MSKGNGDEIPPADKAKLEKILGKAKSEKREQEAAKRTRDARERARQARVRAQKERKDKGK